MNKPIKILAGLLALFIVGMIAFAILFVRVEPYEIGVRLDRWGAGVVERDFDSGFHVGVAGIHEWHRLDRRTHFVTFSETEGTLRAEGTHAVYRPALEIRTEDNNPVTLDVTVTYRIKQGEAHLIVAEGLKTSYVDRVTSAVVRVLREELAKLGPHEFVNTEVRIQRAAETRVELETALAPYHVVPEDVLIRAYRFYEKYEAKMQDKQLRQQLALLENANRDVEDALAKTGKIEKETERFEKEKRGDWDKRLQEVQSQNLVQIATILGEAKKYDLKTRAEADAQYLGLVAEGEFALAEAEALRDELRNAALDTVGGRIYQARAAAANLNFSEVTLNSNDPSIPSVIDIDALVDLLIGEGSAQTAGN